jgi:FkbM family methyltransferase
VSDCSLYIPDLQADLKLQVHNEQDVHISRKIRESGIWEPYETELVCRALTAGDCCIDIGANLGYFTVVAAHCVGSTGRVYAFEPEPRNAELLRRNIALNGFQDRCVAEEAALAEAAGDACLYLHPDNLGDHQLYAGEKTEGGARKSVTVPLHRGDDYFAGRLERVGLVKIDTQGTEYKVVRGLMELFQRSGSELRIIVELTPYSLRAAGDSGAELIRLLAELQLPLHIIDHVEHELVASNAQELITWCDNVDSYPADEGFMNILVGHAPNDGL